MKINDISRIGAINQYHKSNESRTSQSNQKQKLKDEVQISTEAKKLLDAQDTAETQARRQKIQDLKDSVAAGTYYVASNKIAEKLLPYMKE